MAQSNSKPESLNIVDSFQPTNKLVEQVLAYFNKYQQPLPIAWGRYFTTNYPAEYAHKHENNALHHNNIKLLPIARHTNHVGGSHSSGVHDAREGVNDLFSTFTIDYWKSQGSEFLFFLDVEGNHRGPSGSISEEYYKGWSETLISYSREKSKNAVTIRPCVYANYHDNKTFRILKEEKITCDGLWIARYHKSPEKFPSWNEDFAVPKEIQESSIPVFLRQYAGGGQMHLNFDLDQTNPNISDLYTDFLDKLILPPVWNKDGV